MNNKIPFYVKPVYGQNRAFLCPTKEQESLVSDIKRIIGKQTLSRSEMWTLSNMGFEFIQTYQANEFPAETTKQLVTV